MLSDNLRSLRAVFAEHRHGALTISASLVELVVENLERAIDDARALEHAHAPALVRAAASGAPNVVQLFPRPPARPGPDRPEAPPCA